MATNSPTRNTLDCGHPPSSHGPLTTGTARTSDGQEICWDCSHHEEREALRTARSYTAYLMRDAAGKVTLTTWAGGKLADVTSYATRPVGFGFRPSRTYFRATDVHGTHWHGTSPGFGMYARMRRTKGA